MEDFFKYSSILHLAEDTMSTKMCVSPLLAMTRQFVTRRSVIMTRHNEND